MPRKRGAHKPAKPFTIDHWRRWAHQLVLDNGEFWTPEPFQNEFVEDLFSGVPEIWLVVPEGNGKTTLLSGVALYHGDHRDEAAVPVAAASRDQTKILFDQAAGFIRRSEAIQEHFKPYPGYRRINCLRTLGTIQVFAADERTGDGVIPTLALLDELHRHETFGLHDTWMGKLEKRDGQVAAISTAGVPGSEFETLRERARTESPDIKVTVGGKHIRAASEEMILHDWGLRAGDDVDDMELVAKANPLSRITATKLRKKHDSPTMNPSHWSRFVCDLATRTEEAAVGEAEWLAAEIEDPGLEGEPCDVGLDLGWKIDATALVPLFQREGEWIFGQSTVITPPRDTNSLRPERIEAAFRELHARTPIRRVVMDPSNGGEQLAGWLEDELGVEVISHSQQTAPMALAAAKFMETLREGTQKHVNDPDFTRHVLNAVAYELPNGTFKFARPHSSRRSSTEGPRREIDALIAASMVLSVAAAGRYEGPLLELIA